MSDSATPVVAVVVVTYHAADELEQCVAALEQHDRPDIVIVVDNSEPTAGCAPLVAGERALVVRPSHNGGFGAGANAGFAAAYDFHADLIVLLNDDVVVTSGWLRPLVDAMADAPRIGAVQPALVFAGSSPPVVNSLGVEIGRDGAGTDLALGERFDTVDPSTRRIAIFTGGAVMFRREFLDETGGFDERYFLYYEDVDLARRGARLGWMYNCVPASVVEHRKGASTSALGAHLAYLRERNRLWSAFRNESLGVIGGAVWLSIRRLRHRPRGLHARALAVGVAGGLKRALERVRRGST